MEISTRREEFRTLVGVESSRPAGGESTVFRPPFGEEVVVAGRLHEDARTGVARLLEFDRRMEHFQGGTLRCELKGQRLFTVTACGRHPC